MSSASTEIPIGENPAQDAFIGVDPDDTYELKYGGGTFVLGVLPAGLWDRVASRSFDAQQNARRRLIAKLTAEGRDPEEILYTNANGVALSSLDFEITKDDRFRAEMMSTRMEAIKYGLRSHRGFKNKNGKDFPFEREVAKVEGREVMVLTSEVLRVYSVNPPLTEALWTALRRLHELESDAKKV